MFRSIGQALLFVSALTVKDEEPLKDNEALSYGDIKKCIIHLI